MKKFRIGSYIIILIMSISGTFSYAQTPSTCTTCSQSPVFLQSYRNFVEELVSIIGTTQTSGRRAGSYTAPGGFQGGIFNAQSGSAITRAIAGLINNINQKAQTIAVMAALLGTFGKDFVNEGPLGFTILFRPRPFVRDYKLLSDLDTLVSDKVMDLGMSAGYFKNITTDHRSQIRAVLQKYQGTGPDKLFSSAQLKDAADYNAITTFLTRANRKLKRFVVLGSWSFTDKTYNGKNLTLAWNQSGLVQFSNAYQCVRGIDICGGSFEKFIKNMSGVVTTIKNTTKGGGFIKRITDASRRLSTEYKATVKQIQQKGGKNVEYTDEELALMERQRELLRIQYGLQSNEGYYDGRTGFLRNMVRAKVDFNLEEIGMDPKVRNASRKRSSVIGEQNPSIEEGTDASVNTTSIVREKMKKQFLNDIQTTIVNVGILHRTSLGESSVSDPKRLTRLFMGLSDSVFDAVSIIGKERNASSNDLVNNLGVACEKQCNNLFGKCYY